MAAVGLHIPMIETIISASVLVGGMMLMLKISPSVIAVTGSAMFGMFHGYAHMMAATSNASSYVVGLLLASVSLMFLTAAAAMVAKRFQNEIVVQRTLRALGGTLSVAAMVMLVG